MIEKCLHSVGKYNHHTKWGQFWYHFSHPYSTPTPFLDTRIRTSKPVVAQCAKCGRLLVLSTLQLVVFGVINFLAVFAALTLSGIITSELLHRINTGSVAEIVSAIAIIPLYLLLCHIVLSAIKTVVPWRTVAINPDELGVGDTSTEIWLRILAAKEKEQNNFYVSIILSLLPGILLHMILRINNLVP